jgi:hypothetical protein
MTTQSPQRKVGRIKAKYDLTDLDETLRSRYESGEASLRELAEYVNRQVTAAFLEGEPYAPNYVYDVLAGGDDVSSQERNDLRRRLRGDDVDVDALRSDWVSHMAVRTYLQSDLDVDTDRKAGSARDPLETLEKVRGLVNREEKIVEEALKVTDGVDTDGLSIHTDVYVMDDDTGETERIEQFLRQRADDRSDDEFGSGE